MLQSFNFVGISNTTVCVEVLVNEWPLVIPQRQNSLEGPPGLFEKGVFQSPSTTKCKNLKHMQFNNGGCVDDGGCGLVASAWHQMHLKRLEILAIGRAVQDQRNEKEAKFVGHGCHNAMHSKSGSCASTSHRVYLINFNTIMHYDRPAF